MGVAALLSLAFFLVVRGVAERAAEGTQDDILLASATAIADSLRSEDGQVTLDLPYSALSMLGTISDDRVFYRVVSAGDTLTGYADLPLADPAPTLGNPAFSTLVYRGDEVRAAAVVRAVGPATDSQAVIVSVAQTRLGLAAISRRITTTATGVGIGFFLLATLLSLWASHLALRPIVRMTNSVARRGPQDPARCAIRPAPEELAPAGRGSEFVHGAAQRLAQPDRGFYCRGPRTGSALRWRQCARRPN